MEIEEDWHPFGVLWQVDGEVDLQIAHFLVHDVLGRHFGAVSQRFSRVCVWTVAFWCGGYCGMVNFVDMRTKV